MRLADRSSTSTAKALGICALLAAFVLSGCGRSDPNQAAAEETPGVEPDAAGVQVVSDNAVVEPSQTTLPPATTSTTAPPAAAATTYVVQSGDTLSVIADQFGVTLEALSQANNITDINSISPGQELIIPAQG